MKESEFKKKCRQHQSWYRSEVLKVGYDDFVNILLDEDGKEGLNFYDGFNIFNSVKERYPEFRKPLYCNLLRSEHIPFNFFIPLKKDIEFRNNVFNEIMGGFINQIVRIEIEYSPNPKVKYLDDSTSFDTYIEYQHIDGTLGIFGIEVKYTELSYPMIDGSTEKTRMFEKFETSKYKKRTHESGVFQDEDNVFDKLKKDDYRQVWRNHLLGESILIVDKPKFNHFHSLTFYPEGNIHFTKVISEYQNYLKPEFRNRVQGVTYERFFEVCRKHLPNGEFRKWLEYLENRYINNNQ